MSAEATEAPPVADPAAAEVGTTTQEAESGTVVGAAAAAAAAAPERVASPDADADPSALAHLSDFECALCCCLLLDPVTTDGCGHSFCRECLARSLSVKRFCPLCRHPCTTLDALTHPTAQLLANLAQKLFPAEYAARKAAAAAEGLAFQRRAAGATRFGLFLSSQPSFPLAPLSLHIFEPRYRVMISRALATSSRNFIVVCVNEQLARSEPPQQQLEPAALAAPAAAEAAAPPVNDNGEEEHKEAPAAVPAPAAAAPAPMGVAHILDPLRFHPPPFDPMRAGGVDLDVRPNYAVHDGYIGCLMKIVNVRAHADGRSFVECVGVSRVRLEAVHLEDEAAFGLLSAEAHTIEDVPEEPPQGRPAAPMENDGDAAALEEEKQDEIGGGMGLRHRRGGAAGEADVAAGAVSSAGAAAAAASSDGAAASALPSLPLVPPRPAGAVAAGAAAAAAVRSIPDLIAECRGLLTTYCELTGFTMARLGLVHGGQCPPDDRPADFAWWVCRVLPDQVALKQECMASTNLRHRLTLCVEMSHEAIRIAQERTKVQVRFVIVLALLAFFMFLARHLHWV